MKAIFENSRSDALTLRIQQYMDEIRELENKESPSDRERVNAKIMELAESVQFLISGLLRKVDDQMSRDLLKELRNVVKDIRNSHDNSGAKVMGILSGVIGIIGGFGGLCKPFSHGIKSLGKAGWISIAKHTTGHKWMKTLPRVGKPTSAFSGPLSQGIDKGNQIHRDGQEGQRAELSHLQQTFNNMKDERNRSAESNKQRQQATQSAVENKVKRKAEMFNTVASMK